MLIFVTSDLHVLIYKEVNDRTVIFFPQMKTSSRKYPIGGITKKIQFENRLIIAEGDES